MGLKSFNKVLGLGPDLDRVQHNIDDAVRGLQAGAQTAHPQTLTFGAQFSPSNATLAFLRPPFGQVGADGNELLWPMPIAGIVSGLMVLVFIGTSTQGAVVTVRKTLAATGSVSLATPLSVLLPTGVLTASDMVHSFTVAPGDFVSVSIQGVAGITAGTIEPRVYVSFLAT